MSALVVLRFVFFALGAYVLFALLLCFVVARRREVHGKREFRPVGTRPPADRELSYFAKKAESLPKTITTYTAPIESPTESRRSLSALKRDLAAAEVRQELSAPTYRESDYVPCSGWPVDDQTRAWKITPPKHRHADWCVVRHGEAWYAGPAQSYAACLAVERYDFTQNAWLTEQYHPTKVAVFRALGCAA